MGAEVVGREGSSSSRSDRISSLHRRTFAWPASTASADSRLIHSSSISSAGAKATEGDVRCRLAWAIARGHVTQAEGTRPLAANPVYGIGTGAYRGGPSL